MPANKTKFGIFFLLLLAVLFHIETFSAEASNEVRNESLDPLSIDDFRGQFETLMRIDRDLQELVRFVQAEQGRVSCTRNVLEQLKSQQQHLQVLAKTDQRVVDELFREQERRAITAIRKDRTVGFVSGVLASLVAAFLYTLLCRLRYKHRSLD